jgi:serine/threonine-protein kinase
LEREIKGKCSALEREPPLVAFARQRSRRNGVSSPEPADPITKLILAPGALVADHYEVGPIIGAGSMGIVYKARHVELGQPVAIKVIRPDVSRSGSIWRRFSREARALAALHNKHVVRVHNAGTLESGLRYVVMELLNGYSLRVLLQRSKYVPAFRAVDYAMQVCSALGDAHRLNIIHRDIRPENIFLAKYRATEPTIKLLDFGMALFLDDAGQLTVTGRPGASPEYMSPEQLRDARAVDARSDLWGVGVLLYELISGHTPLHGANTAQICLNIAQGNLPRIEESCPDIDPALAAIIHRCLQLDPAERPQTADELCSLLDPFSSRHIVPASTPAPPRITPTPEPPSIPIPLITRSPNAT